MTIKELIQSFEGKSKQEIIEILIKEKTKLLGEQHGLEIKEKKDDNNTNEVKSKVEKGIPYYAIKEYKYKQYNTDELSEMYSKLSKLEDIMENYGIESIQELESRLKSEEQEINDLYRNQLEYEDLQQDRDT